MPIQKPSGFTLIELIMVIVILGILSASIAPKFAGKSTYAEHAFFSDTLNAIRYAQKLAVTTGCNVKFSVSSNSYTISRRGTPASSSCPTVGNAYSLSVPHPSSGTSAYSGSETDVTLTSTVSPFYFYPLGTASDNVTLTINGTKTIQVIKETGLVYE